MRKRERERERERERDGERERERERKREREAEIEATFPTAKSVGNSYIPLLSTSLVYLEKNIGKL